MKIIVIGLGGIGSVLIDRLARYINYNRDIKDPIITLVDGDIYENKNSERQDFFEVGNKAVIKARELSEVFDLIEFECLDEHVTPENIEKVILESTDVVFLCVDNHKTRNLVSNYCGTLDNIVLISGGNDYVDGNVQIYLRREGRDVTPSLCDYHPEIENPEDKSPHEMSCEELSQSEPQLYFTNLGVATIMCWAFYNSIIRAETNVSEIYFDIEKMACHASYREVPNKEPQINSKEYSSCVTQENN